MPKFKLKNTEELQKAGYYWYGLGTAMAHPDKSITVNPTMLEFGNKILDLRIVDRAEKRYTDGRFYYDLDMLKPVSNRNLPDWF